MGYGNHYDTYYVEPLDRKVHFDIEYDEIHCEFNYDYGSISGTHKINGGIYITGMTPEPNQGLTKKQLEVLQKEYIDVILYDWDHPFCEPIIEDIERSFNE